MSGTSQTIEDADDNLQGRELQCQKHQQIPALLYSAM